MPIAGGRCAGRSQCGTEVTWSAWFRGQPVLQGCRLGLELPDRKLPTENPKVLGSNTVTIDEELSPTVPTRAAKFVHKVTELTLSFDGGIDLQVRVYDLGVAYRFVTQLTGYMEVRGETAEFRFANDGACAVSGRNKFHVALRARIQVARAQRDPDSQFCSLPVLLQTNDDVYAAITDADLYDYPAMFLAGTDGLALTARFPSAVSATAPVPHRPVPELMKEIGEKGNRHHHQHESPTDPALTQVAAYSLDKQSAQLVIG